MQFHRKKQTNKKKQADKQKSHKSLFESLSKKKNMKIQETKIPRPATKEDKYCFFMIPKPLADRIKLQPDHPT